MEIETLLLSDLVKQEGQKVAADKIGCHQTAISAAVKKGREIYLEVRNFLNGVCRHERARFKSANSSKFLNGVCRHEQRNEWKLII